MRKILRKAEEALNNFNTIKSRLTEEYKRQVELAKGKNIGANKRRVLSGLVLEKREALRNIEKFLRNTMFLSRKKIAATNEDNAEE